MLAARSPTGQLGALRMLLVAALAGLMMFELGRRFGRKTSKRASSTPASISGRIPPLLVDFAGAVDFAYDPLQHPSGQAIAQDTPAPLRRPPR